MRWFTSIAVFVIGVFFLTISVNSAFNPQVRYSIINFFNPASFSITNSELEREVYTFINKGRPFQSSVRWDEQLASLARERSRAMAENLDFNPRFEGNSHVDELTSKLDKFTVALLIPIPIPKTQKGMAIETVSKWMNKHKEIITNPFLENVGVGVWNKGTTYYFTAYFASLSFTGIPPPPQYPS